MSGAISAIETLNAPNDVDQPDASLRELLDHIAVELAHEYIRLTEAAAETEPE